MSKVIIPNPSPSRQARLNALAASAELARLRTVEPSADGRRGFWIEKYVEEERRLREARQ